MFVYNVGLCNFGFGNKCVSYSSRISAGGISSVGTVLSHLFGIRMSVTNLFFNGILFAFGYKSLGKYAVVQTLIGIIMLSAFFEITSIIPVYTENELIAVICGGVLMGAGSRPGCYARCVNGRK